MKKLLALLLAIVMLLSLTACGGATANEDGVKISSKLETFEMRVQPDGVEEPAKVTIGYPKSFTLEEAEAWTVLIDEKKDVEINAYFVNDYDCYSINEEYAKEEYFFYEAAEFSGRKGYVCKSDEASSTVEVYVYLECVAEIDDVYMCFYISSASRDLDTDPMDLYKLKEVQQVLNSIVYTAPAVPAA